jgi:uncharacterized protein YdhG (YjbR/CyaY superfamily)
MISKAKDVATYLAEMPAARRPMMEKLRKLCKQNLRGYEEAMEYGMPVYKRDGKAEVGLASQKQNITLYVMKKDVVDEFRSELGASIGKGCIRFSKPEKIDFEVVQRLLQRTAASQSQSC